VQETNKLHFVTNGGQKWVGGRHRHNFLSQSVGLRTIFIIFLSPRWHRGSGNTLPSPEWRLSVAPSPSFCVSLLGEKAGGVSQPASVLPASGLIGVQPSYYPGAFVNYQPSDVYHWYHIYANAEA